ncbi:MAG: hypothetical protein HZT40_07640 [Candidatus Thiothrix singaporensis]|uniref:Uncharacterized protein n=1 Tax=Candidatus Thiothrix singaporensis TaxID=2799669 RepID=A0A7L6AQX1_9GAMM|nr:MAG: hypothetical protein HZT40_07640 [Candidatus Thiothrix singaporensis]
MTITRLWQTEDFDSLSWHDVHIHGFQLESFITNEGVADIIFDIDYILKWENTNNKLLFTVCRATLRFHKVFGMKFMLDYATPTASMCPFSINGIEREPLTYPTGFNSFHWSIKVNWPQGYIEFDSPGFTQTLIGTPIVQSTQSLSFEERDKL